MPGRDETGEYWLVVGRGDGVGDALAAADIGLGAVDGQGGADGQHEFAGTVEIHGNQGDVAFGRGKCPQAEAIGGRGRDTDIHRCAWIASDGADR